MKKTLLIIASALVMSIAAKADEFVPGWYLGIKGGAQYTAGETSFGKLISPAAALNAGYQFTRTVGLRADIAAWQGKGYMPLIDKGYKYNYGQLGFDVTFNLIDMFSKNYKRHIVNPYIFAGLGGVLGFNNKEVKALEEAYPLGVNTYNRWEGTTLSPLGRLGLGVDFKVSDRVAINLELTDNVMADKMNSKKGEALKLGKDGRFDFDYNISALLGVKIALGETEGTRAAAAAAAALAAEQAAKEAAAALAAQRAAEQAAAEKAAAEAAAKAAAEKAAAEAAAAEAARLAAIPVELKNENILFNLDKSYIRKSEKAKIAEIVEILTANPAARVELTAHADKNTGNPTHNWGLSERRVKSVAKALKDAGIDESRIKTAFKGDTDNQFPTPAQNRVCVAVVYNK